MRAAASPRAPRAPRRRRTVTRLVSLAFVGYAAYALLGLAGWTGGSGVPRDGPWRAGRRRTPRALLAKTQDRRDTPRLKRCMNQFYADLFWGPGPDSQGKGKVKGKCLSRQPTQSEPPLALRGGQLVGAGLGLGAPGWAC